MRTDNSTPRTTEQPERFDEFTGGYDMTDHDRAAKRINADLRKLPTPRAGHTPGPWGVFVPHDGCVSEAGSCPASVRADGHHVANVMMQGKATAANARLIASAPDLLEACKAAVFGANHIDCVRAMQEVLPQLRAAIARATNGGVQ